MSGGQEETPHLDDDHSGEDEFAVRDLDNGQLTEIMDAGGS